MTCPAPRIGPKARIHRTLDTMSDSIIVNPISDAELERRWRLVRAAMRKADIDALVVQATQDWLGGYLKWLTDLPATNGYPTTLIFPREGSMTLIEQGPMGVSRELRDDPIHRGIGRKCYTSSFSSVHYSATYDAQITLAELRSAGFRRVGLVATAQMQYDFCDYLKRSLPTDQLVAATDLIDDIKAIKSRRNSSGSARRPFCRTQSSARSPTGSNRASETSRSQPSRSMSPRTWAANKAFSWAVRRGWVNRLPSGRGTRRAVGSSAVSISACWSK